MMVQVFLTPLLTMERLIAVAAPLSTVGQSTKKRAWCISLVVTIGKHDLSYHALLPSPAWV